MRIIFMGTPDFSVPTLMELIGQCYDGGHEIVACYSQPPRPAGRGQQEKKSPVHEVAEKFGIPVLTPTSLKTEEAQAQFKSLEADVAVVVAYGLLLPKAILEAPTYGCYNGHASLLPRWRGAAPIQRAIMAGDDETGVMIMKMDIGLDTGDIAMAERIAISETMTAGELHDKLSFLTGNLMTLAMAALNRDGLNLTPQSEDGILYAAKIDKAEARIDWTKSAQEIHNQIRGLSPFPGSWCEMEIGSKPIRVKLLRSELLGQDEVLGNAGEVLDDQLTIACGKGSLRLTQLQRAGKQAMNTEDFLRGNEITPKMRLL
jgi:methionyl-tRNA formyltransferase